MAWQQQEEEGILFLFLFYLINPASSRLPLGCFALHFSPFITKSRSLRMLYANDIRTAVVFLFECIFHVRVVVMQMQMTDNRRHPEACLLF